MDFMKEFEEYLPKWSEEKHKPIPTRKHMDKWTEAWQDFLSEHLTEKYHEISAEYKNMKLKTAENMAMIEPLPEPLSESEDIKEAVVKKSTWDLVQEKRKKKS